MLDYTHLSALAAVIRTGSFERAAQHLNVTPSAISQRIKLLEERLGTVLVIRGQPCTATEVGQRLCQHVEQVALLENSLRGSFPGLQTESRPVTLRVAVNADSLATWLIPAMAKVEGFLFDLVLDNEDHSPEWLRRGEVAAAVTARGTPIQGCDCHSLGALRYVATASPQYHDRWFADGFSEPAAAYAPCLIFKQNDRLHVEWMRQVLGGNVHPPLHQLPSSQACLDAALAGIGWGMNPERLVIDHLRAGRLVTLRPDQPLDIPLFWQQSRIVSPVLDHLTQAVVHGARTTLVPV
ncbi:LysR family transcriptional regulator ArgP [Microvirga calopogonii]|uniref:LysR family transcriptional regulator ArgP n=1 Tax=Microvirga calopogonii TaxID=2078013 RepID=UPI000E0D5090|nr:LysR family transcriptional regulator ArgP [Microvirga calopogonii]